MTQHAKASQIYHFYPHLMNPPAYQFLQNDLIKYLNCSVCNSVMHTPTRLHPCAHTFCEKCCPPPGPCPRCQATVLVRQPDLTAINLISDLTVKCTAKDCPFQGSFEAFKTTHQSKCSLRRWGSIQAWVSQIQETLGQRNREQREKKGPGVVENVQEDEIMMPEAMIDASDLEQSSIGSSSGRKVYSLVLSEEGTRNEQTFIECIQLDRVNEQKKQTKNPSYAALSVIPNRPSKMQQKLKQPTIYL